MNRKIGYLRPDRKQSRQTHALTWAVHPRSSSVELNALEINSADGFKDLFVFELGTVCENREPSARTVSFAELSQHPHRLVKCWKHRWLTIPGESNHIKRRVALRDRRKFPRQSFF